MRRRKKRENRKVCPGRVGQDLCRSVFMGGTGEESECEEEDRGSEEGSEEEQKI